MHSATMPITTREAWLNAVAEGMRPWFKSQGLNLPPFRVSIGFPSKGSRGKAIGECWTDSASADGHHEIFLRPDRADSMDVAATLCHELIHAAVGIKVGHGSAFKRAANALGLEGPMKATTAGEDFKEWCEPILEAVGPLPHATLSLASESSGPAKQTTRMLKAACACGYTVRLSAKWARVGAWCPEHGAMDVPGLDGEEDEPDPP